MTRTGALLWKEWRDHRVAMAVSAAVIPLVSWPVQRYAFKFAEPEWTWWWTLPICVGLAVAVVAADLFATDLSTDRMNAFVSLPVPVRRHFTVRTAFLVAVAIAFGAWTVAVNAAIVGAWGAPGAVALLFGAFDPTAEGSAYCATAVAAVVLLSALGVGGFRAVLGGLALSGIAVGATHFATSRLLPVPQYESPSSARTVSSILAGAAVLAVAAFVAFVASRGLPSMRRRGALWAAGILVVAFGAPLAGAACTAWRTWSMSPYDSGFRLMDSRVSPDGRFVSVVGTNEAFGSSGACRSWIVPVDGGRLLEWPHRNDYAAGWTADGLVWIGRYDEMRQQAPRDFGVLARPETGEVVERLTNEASANARLAGGWRIGPRWTQWMGWDRQFARKASKGAPTTYTWRLWVVDGNLERTIDAHWAAATPKVGEALIVTSDDKLALVDLAGGEPRVVADDATSLSYWLTGSPDGSKYLVGTSKGNVVLDGTTWRRLAGPFRDAGVIWCVTSGARSLVAVSDKDCEHVGRLVDADSGREIAIDPTLDVAGTYGAVQPLADGGLVARSGEGSLLLLDADGKLVRKLFPPEGN